MKSIKRTNDGNSAPPRLRPFLNLDTLNNLPTWSKGPGADTEERAGAIRAAGYEGVQGIDAIAYRDFGLDVCTLGRANTPDEIDELAREWADTGYLCGTYHIGWGFESDSEIDGLVSTVIDSSDKHGIPLYIETHRATITQDPARTIATVQRNPGLRLNADFSHWYTGLELVYGGVEWKFDLMEPVFQRTGFMHARVGNSGHMQVPLGDPSMEVAMQHYRDMWTRAMKGFLRGAGPGDFLIFAPELLEAGINYARLYQGDDGGWHEDSDRWLESIDLVTVAQECFRAAQEAPGPR